MGRPRTPRYWLFCLLAGVMLLSGCGTDFFWVETIKPVSTSTSTTTTSTTTTTTTRPKATTTTTAGAKVATTTTTTPQPAATTTTTAGPGSGTAGEPGPGGTQMAAPPPPIVPEPEFPSPLTGLPMDDAAARRPVLVVKIDNAPKARPQVGLNEADVVIEEGVEGGITRFAALFHSRQSAPVGPVRSARSTDIMLISALNHPLFSYSGANDIFKQYVADAPLIDVGVDQHPDKYKRDSTRPSPNNLFSATPDLFPLAPEISKAPPPLFAFRRPGEAASGAKAKPVAGVNVYWKGASKQTDVQWDWDETARGWKRTQNAEAHVDGAGKQVAPPNVVVQFCTYHDTGLVDSSGTAVPEADVIGSGEAWILTGGMLIPAKWSKPSKEEVTRYVDTSGAEVRLAQGSTWVELVPPEQATER